MRRVWQDYHSPRRVLQEQMRPCRSDQPVRRMVDAVEQRHLAQLEWIDTFEAGEVVTILGRIGRRW